MVAKVIFGKDIDGAVRYNEMKLRQGVAVCLGGEGFGASPERLSALEKVRRFQKRTALNRMCRTNTLHISLNFPPDEVLTTEQLTTIARSYMEQIGYGDQPYLIYQHFDAAHPHIHLVTTNILANGDRIPSHRFGATVSEPARLAIEKTFGLIPASSRAHSQRPGLQPLDETILQYGDEATKNAIARIVRTVVAAYRFGSLQELNAVLRIYNVVADPGAEGTKRRLNKGLVYHMTDGAGQKIGKGINAGKIHERPTLATLEKMYVFKTEARRAFRGRVARILTDALKTAHSLEDFERQIATFGIQAQFHTTGQDLVYGVTFVDTRARVVFNGSDLRTDLSAPAILRQISANGDVNRTFNALFVRQLIGRTDWRKTPAAIMRTWAKAGLSLQQVGATGRQTIWGAGHVLSPAHSFVPLPPSVRAWLSTLRQQQQTGATAHTPAAGIASAIAAYGRWQLAAGWQQMADTAFAVTDYLYTGNYTPHQFRQKKKKKKTRRL